MSEMGDWVSALHDRLATVPDPGVPVPGPVETAPVTEPTPGVTVPDAPVAGDALPPTLRDWLLQQHGGANVLNDAQYDYFKGDEVLRQIQQFDPNARWTTTDIGGGEGGGVGRGRRLDFDVTKLPGVGGPGRGASIYDTGFVPVYDDSKLHNSNMVYNDALYGNLTPYRNVDKGPTPFLEKYGPLIAAAIAMGGPAAAAALAAGGIGAGAGAASLGAGAGAWGGAALADGAAAAPWWATSAVKAIPTLGKNVGALTAPNYATGPVAKAPVQYNPDAYNSGGSPAKPNNNDSSLVATQFAADPYGFSGQQ
jgi:hypothetical protein